MELRQMQNANEENSLNDYQKKTKCVVCGANGTETDINTKKDYQLFSPYKKHLIYTNKLKVFLCGDNCLEKYNLRRLLLLAGCPLNLVCFEAEQKDLLEKYTAKDKGLFLWGDTGTMKSSFAVSLLREYLKKGEYSIQFVKIPKLIIELQNTFNGQRKEITQKDILEEASDYKLLVLDDIGANKTTDYVRQSLYYVIDEREANCRKTVFTSNLSLATLDKTIDERISSRIGGMCDVVHFIGKDRRLE